jgi:hypothetical protein
MLKVVFLFLVMFGLIHLTIFLLKKLSAKQVFALTNTLFYVIISSSVAVFLMSVLVAIF